MKYLALILFFLPVAVNAFGFTDLSASRSFNTAYQNTTGETLVVMILDESVSSNSYRNAYASSTNNFSNLAATNRVNFRRTATAMGDTSIFFVPDGWYYYVYGSGDTAEDFWYEYLFSDLYPVDPSGGGSSATSTVITNSYSESQTLFFGFVLFFLTIITIMFLTSRYDR